ncbi:hypothetical protein UPYG_G00121580 [Umbra pygmaea]|uniref:Uncharacterized protein n=1 Tax=Umbra pygmaea TaxID=75934 RepID=A0ABD0XKG2_UMBPY
MNNTGERREQGGPILSPSLIVIRCTSINELAPPNTPPGCIFIPLSIRDQQLTWAHTTLSAGDSGRWLLVPWWRPSPGACILLM